jgi:sterol desaturase/sphingolipid hydroxylase (fatty acid hydroxylase superfamily)
MIGVILIGTAILLIILERNPRLRFRVSSLFRRYFVTDVLYLSTGFIAGGTLAIQYVAHGSEWFGSTFNFPRFSSLEWPLWLSVFLALAALDLGNYTAHYLLHRFEWLWAFHKIHHSSPTLDWLAAFRSHIAEQILRRLLAPILLILFGFPLEAVTIAGAIIIVWIMFTHSNLGVNLGFLEILLITPRLHRIHHIDDSATKNLGTVFSFWDRLRGTLVVSAPADEIQFGNGEANYPQSWLAQFIEPFSKGETKGTPSS